MIKTMLDIQAKAKSVRKRVLSVACAHDLEVMLAVDEAVNKGIVEPVMVGDVEKIKKIAKEKNIDISNWQLVDEKDDFNAAMKAVKYVSEGKADMIMKGMIATGTFLKAVLNKEWGLRSGSLLSHVALIEVPTYHKLVAVTDAAMNVAPDIMAKVDIINNSVKVMRALGINKPKVAAICAVETVNIAMQPTIDAALLAKMSDRNQIKNCVVDGPLALDNAISKEASEHKGIISEVAGDADIILCPDIEAGNVLYKALSFLAEAKIAAIIVGASCPIVLT
ncbi:MAG: bifunctional enoyl-CoA hydratase/phosphate acetyltransferase, partial [Candidatus Muirbacterium halophilum]|nr:bifunctional enoyl-CoA hydratase/phosphate acetyltransferase [Candidatus Muirbacterium halophilum]